MQVSFHFFFTCFFIFLFMFFFIRTDMAPRQPWSRVSVAELRLCCRDVQPTGWRRPIECLIFIGHFPQKSLKTSGSFAKNDLQLEASYGSSPPCIAVGVSLILNLPSQSPRSLLNGLYCTWSVLESQSPISISHLNLPSQSPISIS